MCNIFTHIREKILQICDTFGKLCLLGSALGHPSEAASLSAVVARAAGGTFSQSCPGKVATQGLFLGSALFG
jgi:hypothetical protein